jgi:broad specificity phosphatase PhoE
LNSLRTRNTGGILPCRWSDTLALENNEWPSQGPSLSNYPIIKLSNYMTVYFIRHGETDLNRMNIVQGSGMDTELNELGRAQAKAFFDNYQDAGFELVVTSRLRRTHQTVQHFLEQNIPWHQTEDINEISWGIFEGKGPTAARHDAFYELLANWKQGNVDAAMPNGESARQLGERVSRFLAWLRTRQEQKILVATHGRTLRAIVSHLRGNHLSEMDGVAHLNTGCYVVHFQQDGVIFELENDVAHLELADLLPIE